MLSIGRASFANMRDQLRYPTHVEGSLEYGGMVGPTIIADLSASGARLRCSLHLPPGSTVVLKANALDVRAIVVRVICDGYGVRFCGDNIDPLQVVRENYAGLEHLRRAQRPDVVATVTRPPALQR